MKIEVNEVFGVAKLMQSWIFPRLDPRKVKAYELKYYTTKSVKWGHCFHHLKGWYIPKKKGG